jgi:hypothetical protein
MSLNFKHDEESDPEVSSVDTSGPEQMQVQVQILDDEVLKNQALITQIKQYAAEIQCSDFHGKGSIEDYTALFQAAGKIADDVKRIELDVDVQGFEEFGKAADELSALFESFTLKMQNLTIIDDTRFLNAVASSLAKIVNLSNVFGRFKKTVTATTNINIPKSVQEASIAVAGVMDEVSCAMGYITYFIDPDVKIALPNAALCESDKKDISKAVELITNWNDICARGVTEALENNDDIVHFKQSNADFKSKTKVLKALTEKLRSKIGLK